MTQRILILNTGGNAPQFIHDWAPVDGNAFQANNIDQITDLAGATVKRRITSYPTPIARMHFFDDAFQFVYNTQQGTGATIYHQAVSHCLDVWEILFNWDVFKDKITVTEWSYDSIEKLKKSTKNGHQILGKSLDLFLNHDNTVQLKDTINNIYLFSCIDEDSKDHLFAGSSPFTGFFTIDFPKNEKGETIYPKLTVPGTSNIRFFESNRSIDQRDEEFQE